MYVILGEGFASGFAGCCAIAQIDAITNSKVKSRFFIWLSSIQALSTQQSAKETPSVREQTEITIENNACLFFVFRSPDPATRDHGDHPIPWFTNLYKLLAEFWILTSCS